MYVCIAYDTSSMLYAAYVPCQDKISNNRSGMIFLECCYDLRFPRILGTWLLMHASNRKSKLIACLLRIVLHSTFFQSHQKQHPSQVRCEKKNTHKYTYQAQDNFSWTATRIGYTCNETPYNKQRKRKGYKKSAGKVMICVNETTAMRYTPRTGWNDRLHDFVGLSIEREHERELWKRLILIELHRIG